VRLLLIGLVAGFLSALFGVGGGLVLVPLLILLLAFPERVAMATSLAAIGVIASVGVISYGLRGEVDPGAAAVVGLPAAVGAIVGTGIQQRVTGRALGLGFAAFLVVVGVLLLV
jgi:uncharacterized membrane protein YfcA